MVSYLEGALKRKIAAGFAGRLTRGRLRRVGSSTMDEAGDLEESSASTFTFEGIRESFSATFRAQAGIPEKDVSILILLGSLVPETTPLPDDEVYLGAPWQKWHKLRSILEIDPAGASAKCQAYEIPDPTA